ncbi:type II toxin-antitoxin system RelE/ParE family toxin [Rhodohalobacter sp. SW132]|uniref:type II toxin-antitoxin system RelE/ParE family toxin n=1 Tax=Rhodohalobacter sp. SW132 TaxID=2293433 RepID=UPI000E222F74|nr:type II toxin-antitoxin system RelE/ParE family toxin [Rhodohalobacter sp. SW132]
MTFSILLDRRAIDDIQEAIDYYEENEPGLGSKFEDDLNNRLVTLSENPFFQIRYDNVRCLPLKIYPYMIHYSVNEKQKTIIVRSVLNTFKDPKNWGKL